MSGSKLPRAVQRLVRLSVRPTSRPILEACPKLLQAADSGRGFSWLPNLQAERQKLLSPFKIAPQQQRGINIDTHGEEGEELSEKDYHRLADLTLGEVMAKLETLIEETSGIADSDLEYSQGVLTLNLGSHGTYVINKQGPNKQLWMSSPISGPVRYDLVDGRWIYKHDGHVFQERLAEELEDITGKENIDLDQAPEVAKGFVGYGADPT